MGMNGQKKNYDTYIYNTSIYVYLQRILGDASDESGPFGTIYYYDKRRSIGSWYMENAHSLALNGAWVIRGGSSFYGKDGGIFAFGNNNPILIPYTSFRLILTPTTPN